MINKKILALALISTSGFVFADAPVIDDSQHYAYNQAESQKDPRINNDNSVFVLSESDKKNSDKSELDPDGTDQKLQLLLSKMEQMQQDISELRGQLEVQSHTLEKAGFLKTKVKVAKKIADPVLVKKDFKTPKIASSKIPKTTELSVKQTKKAKIDLQSIQLRQSDDPMDEQLNYVAAYEHVKHKHYQQAITAMQSFLKSYPEGPYAANAHYWLGELYIVNNKNDKAKAEFETIINDFSDSNKLASAQYKLGVTLEKLGNKDEAQAQFIKVTEEFPGTAIARLARTKLI